MQFVAPLIAALVPLAIAPGLLYYFDITPKVSIFLLGVSLALVFQRKITVSRTFALVLGAQWTVFALATLFSSNTALSWNGNVWRRSGLITMTGVLVFALLTAAWIAADHSRARVLLRAMCASGALGAIYGILQYFEWDPFLPAKSYQAGEGPFTIVRPPGTLGHADYFAAWLLYIVFGGIALARMEERRWLRIAACSASGLAVIAIVLSGTRAALVALAAGVLALWWFARPRVSFRWAAVAMACAVLFFVSAAGSKMRARVHWSLDDAGGGARLLLWRDALSMAAHRPLLGFGPETFSTEFPRFQSLALARAYPDFYQESPHNLVLDTAAGQGLPGVVALALLLWFVFRVGRKTEAPLIAGLVAALVCQSFSVFVLSTALYFYLLIAVIVGLSAPLPNGHGSVTRLAGFALALLFAVYAVRIAVADRAPDLVYSRQMAAAGNAQQALEAGMRATQTAEDRQNAWYNLATLQAALGDTAGVERSLRNAIACAPNWFKPHWTLAQLLALTNRHAEAVTEAARAVETDGGKHTEVSETWRNLQR